MGLELVTGRRCLLSSLRCCLPRVARHRASPAPPSPGAIESNHPYARVEPGAVVPGGAATTSKEELDRIATMKKAEFAPDRWFNPHKSSLGVGNYDVVVVETGTPTAPTCSRPCKRFKKRACGWNESSPGWNCGDNRFRSAR